MMQNIIDIITTEGLKFPFKDKNWANKFGVYCLINLIPTFVVFTVAFFTIIPFLGIFALLLLVILLPIMILLTIYLQGYILEIIRRVMHGDKEEIPEHNDIKTILKLGLMRFLIEFPPAFLGTIFILLSVGLIVGGSFLLSQETSIIGIILIILGIIFTIAAILLTLLITTIILPAMIYIYLQTKSMQSAYHLQNIKKVVNSAWKEFLIVWLFAIVGSMLVSTLSQVPCIGIFVIVVGYAYVSFVLALVMGKIYSNISTRDKIKLT